MIMEYIKSVFFKNKLILKECLICEKKFQPSPRSKELCFKCVYNFVDLKIHLRTCETVKFLLKTKDHKTPVEANIPCNAHKDE